MSEDPLATFVTHLERTAPEVIRSMRPAPAQSLERLRFVAPHLPPEYLRFVELMGGNRRGELAPLLPNDEFHIEHALEYYRSERVTPPPDDWVFLLQRFEHELPSYCWHLAPVTSDHPAHPEGLYRVAHGGIVEGVLQDVAHHGTLEEFLLHWAFIIRFPGGRPGTMAFERYPDDECEAGEYFVDVVEEAGFRTIAGGDPHDWYQLLEHEDGSWLWLSRNPVYLSLFDRYNVDIRAPTHERMIELCILIRDELDAE